MIRFVFRRVLWAVPVLFIVTFLTFWAVKASTDPVASYVSLNPRATPEQIQQYKETNGLIGSTPEQYFNWLGNFLSGDWGNSIKGNRPVFPELKDALANTLVLGTISLTVGVLVGCTIGIISALRQYSAFDTAATGTAFVGISIPPFISAVLLQVLVAVSLTAWLGADEPILPVAGVYPPGHQGFSLWLRSKHLILPVTVVAIQIIAVYSRFMRASLLEAKQSEYMRTARSKGISERTVVVKHAMRNALVPVVTVSAIQARRHRRRTDHHRAHLRVQGHRRLPHHRARQRRLPPDHAADGDHRVLGHHLQPHRRHRLRMARPEDPSWLKR